jgi:NAD(P)-dependent dehydrogenase (short-subunit alcohol dehydrogenase family)
MTEAFVGELFSVKDKVILVTGSNRGYGYAIAEGLNKAGAIVIRIDLSFDTRLNTDDFEFDLANKIQIKSLVEKINKKYGRIDALVNNAGVSISSANAYTDNEAYEKTLAINLHSVFELCCTVCPIRANKNSGSIVNITSLGAELGFPNNPAYQISKAGLKQLTKAVARDWSVNNIRANNICPGYIKTSMTKNSYEDKILNANR